MRWPVPVLLAYLLLALEPPIKEALRAVPLNISPSLVFPLIVFIALFATSTAALWTALLIGLAVDLTTVRGTNALAIAGPHALGYVAAAYFVLTVRPMVMRRNPVILGLLSMVGLALASVVIVFIFALRRTFFSGSWADENTTSLLADLWQRLIGAGYTGAAALILAAVFFPLQQHFGFHDATVRRPFVKKY